MIKSPNTKHSRLRPILVATTITGTLLGITSCSASNENKYPYDDEAVVTGKGYAPERDRSYSCGRTTCHHTSEPSLYIEVRVCTPREGSDIIMDCEYPRSIEVDLEEFNKIEVGDTVEVIVGKYGLVLNDNQE